MVASGTAVRWRPIRHRCRDGAAPPPGVCGADGPWRAERLGGAG